MSLIDLLQMSAKLAAIEDLPFKRLQILFDDKLKGGRTLTLPRVLNYPRLNFIRRGTFPAELDRSIETV